jgi:DNA repair exonuclease SbcCD ATPase subunit
MFIKGVKLKNFCQHLDREFTFASGLNLIVGPNGSGKSNILNGIYGGLTGDFSRNHGKTADNVAINKVAGMESSVDVEFSHGEHDMRIVRRLDQSERQLFLNGSVYTADKEVADKLADVLEVDRSVLDQYVFIEQWDHFGPLALSPKSRIEAFQKLYKIDHLNKISAALGSGDVKLADVGKAVFNVNDLQNNLLELEKKKAELEAQKAGMPSIDDLDNQITEQMAITNSYNQKVKLLASTETRNAAIAKIEETIAAIVSEIDALKADLISVGDSLEASQDNYSLAQSADADWVRYDNYITTLNKLSADAAKLEAEKSSKVVPVKPEGYVDNLSEVQSELDAIKFAHEQNRQFISSIDVDSDTATCPTCGTSAKTLKKKWDKAQKDNEAISVKMEELTKALADTAAYDRAAAVYQAWLSGFEKRQDSVNKAISSLVIFAMPSCSKEDAKSIIQNYKALEKRMIDISKEINSREVKLATANASKDQNIVELRKEEEELVSLSSITDSEAKAAAGVITSIRASKAEINSIITQLAVVASETKNTLDKIDAANRQARLADIHASWNSRVEELKKVYKFNALPTLVCYKYTEKVVAELNNTLNQIGVPFNIELENDLSFTANLGSHRIPANRLSGGQKVILAIAYRIAVNFTFASSLGLLCLDEPTVGLDEANISALEKAFECLREFSDSNGVQIIVVTHEKGIGHLFDHTIDLARV